MSEFVRPVCLSAKKEKPQNYYTISGWGITNSETGTQSDVLQYANVNLFDFKECNSLAPAEVKPLDASQFCASGDHGKDPGVFTRFYYSNSKVAFVRYTRKSRSSSCP